LEEVVLDHMIGITMGIWFVLLMLILDVQRIGRRDKNEMKIYRNKLYSIQDAAKRGGVTEDQINEMIIHHVVMTNKQFSTNFIFGEDIPELKTKWEEYQDKKGKTKKVDVTILRMDKGD